jgi:hypothetical protein
MFIPLSVFFHILTFLCTSLVCCCPRQDIAPFIQHIQFFVQRYMLGQAVAQPDIQSPDKLKKGFCFFKA